MIATLPLPTHDRHCWSIEEMPNGRDAFGQPIARKRFPMVNVYFCYDDNVGLMRSWSVVPRIGDTIAIAELSAKVGPLVVSDVVWEGDGQPVATVFVSKRKGAAGAA
jgi:hypothetical protein